MVLLLQPWSTATSQTANRTTAKPPITLIHTAASRLYIGQLGTGVARDESPTVTDVRDGGEIDEVVTTPS